MIIYNISEKIREKLKGDFYCSGMIIFGSSKQEKLLTFESLVNKTKYAVALTFESHIDLQILNSESSIVNKQPALQFVNIFIKSLMHGMKYVEIGLNAQFFMQKDNFIDRVQGTQLKVWRGFKTAVDIYENNQVKLLIDFSCKILRKDTMHDYIINLKFQRKNNQFISREVKGRSVLATYGNYRIYRVQDIDFTKNPRSKVDDLKINFIEYYQQNYAIVIKDDT